MADFAVTEDKSRTPTDIDREVERLAERLRQHSEADELRQIRAEIQDLARWRRNHLVSVPSLDD